MDRVIFFAEIRTHLFGKLSPSQVAGVTAILDAWDQHAPNSDLRFIAYALGTAYREAGAGMQPIREIGKGKGKPYGLPAGPYGQIFYGRGLVQETWLRNYQFATKRLRELGIIGLADDLVKNADLALRPDIAAAIMVFGMIEGWFTTKKLADYFAGPRSDWIDARRIINGIDHAALVASYAMIFYHALQAATAHAKAA